MKKKKYDIIIYSCLAGALVLICLGYWDNLKDLKAADLSFSIKQSNDFNSSEVKGTNIELEPEELLNIDKNSIIKKYLDSLLDRITTDTLISYDMIKSWDNYQILNIAYKREIADNYYAYSVDIKINNQDALLPTKKNEKLSTKDYLVITLNINIAYSKVKNGYLVKKIDIPTEN